MTARLDKAIARNKLALALFKAGYDPSQPRGEHGRWSASGINQAVNEKWSYLAPKAKEALATAAAAIITLYPHGAGQGTGPETEVIKDMLLNLSTTMKVSVSSARDHVVDVFKHMRDKRLKKAKDPEVERLDRAIAHLQGLDLTNKGK